MGKKTDYGRGHNTFLEYVDFIINHPSYEGMPDLHIDTGEIQWEAPSNRKSGKFKDTHLRRRDWWRRKAIQLGIDPASPHWISRTAKILHPTKHKPCKRCGRIMDIRYSYPSATLLNRIRKLDYVDESFVLDPLEHVTELIPRLIDRFGDQVYSDIPSLFKTGTISPPTYLEDLDSWLEWLSTSYIASEPSTLSPGVMSNAPDRLDGFHSFNLCCRSKADKGRSKENLQSYVTDRRVFEYWVEGDWVAADRLMGLVRTNPQLKSENCANGHLGPCSADHIGPISLGFMHRPQFRLLCKACNSAKNNRMTLSDVVSLREFESNGNNVASWYCQTLWDIRKNDVNSEETALRISKMLRDNRHTVMLILNEIANEGHLTFLSTFLGLDYADYDVLFNNLQAVDHITYFDQLEHIPRTTKYATEQKARRLRVAFNALWDYADKKNRNALLIMNEQIREKIDQVISELEKVSEKTYELDTKIAGLFSSDLSWQDEDARRLVRLIPAETEQLDAFKSAKDLLVEAMNLVAVRLSDMWFDDRYVRAELDDLLS